MFACCVSYLLQEFQQPSATEDATQKSIESFERSSSIDVDKLEVEHRQCEERAEQRREGEAAQHKHRTASVLHVWGVGMALTLGGQFYAWNLSLTAGLGSFAITMVLVGTAYVSLYMCLAEMSSAVPFAGGSYGYARVTMGMHVAFFAGCCEATEYLGATCFLILTLGQMLTAMTGWPPAYLPLVWLLVFNPAYALFFSRRRALFHRFCLWSSVLSVGSVLVFCVATVPNMDFARYSKWAENNSLFRGGFASFMLALANAPWLFIGAEGVPLMSESVIKPKENIPKGLITASLTGIVTAFALVFAVVSNPSGIDELSSVPLFPLSSGLQRTFHTSSVWLGLVSFGPNFFNLYAIVWAWGRIVSSMAGSHLLPKALEKTPDRDTSDVAVITLFVLSYGLCVLAWKLPEAGAILTAFVPMTAFASYICQLLSFVIMRLWYSSLPRSFRNPLGLCGALYSGLVFSLCFVAVLYYMNGYLPLVCFAIYGGAVSFYYQCYAHKHEYFSFEEKSEMFIAYVIKSNLRKQKAKTPTIKSMRMSINPMARCSIATDDDTPTPRTPL